MHYLVATCVVALGLVACDRHRPSLTPVAPGQYVDGDSVVAVTPLIDTLRLVLRSRDGRTREESWVLHPSGSLITTSGRVIHTAEEAKRYRVKEMFAMQREVLEMERSSRP